MATKQKPPKTDSMVGAGRASQAIKMRFDPLPNLRPETLVRYHQQFERGYLRDAALTWDKITRLDDRVKTVVPKRCKAPTRYGYDIVAGKGLEKDPRAQKHIKTLTYFYENLRAVDALDLNVRGGIKLMLRQMMTAVGNQYAVHEIVWRPLPGGLTAELRYTPLWFFENTTGKLRYLRADSDLTGQDLEEGGWMVHVGDGLMEATAVAWMYKRLPLRDWLIYSGKHGAPGLHGETTATEGSAEWKVLEDALRNFSIDLAMITNPGNKITPIDISTRGDLPYPKLIDLMNRAIVTLWRGGDLSTMSSGPDAVGASVQGDESDILEQGDAEELTDTVNEQLDRLVIRYAHGEEPCAWFKLKTAQRQDVKDDIEVDTFLATRGFPFTAQVLADRYDRTLPGAGEELLEAPAASNAGLGTMTAELNPRLRLANSDLQLPTSDLRPPTSELAAADSMLSAQAAPLNAWMNDIERLLRDTTLSDAALLDVLENKVRAMPKELLTRENLAAIAAPLEAALGQAAAQAIAATVVPSNHEPLNLKGA